MSGTDDEKPVWAGYLERPAVRGIMNGVIFAAVLTAIQYWGFLSEPEPITDDLIARNLIAGVVVGFAAYILSFWRSRRNEAAASAARKTVERKLGKDDEDDRG